MAKTDNANDAKGTQTLTAPQTGPVNLDCKTPAAIAEALTKTIGVTKCSASWFNLSILGILAGVYIGFGAALATLVTNDLAKFLGFGLSQFFGGAVFSVGLMLVVIAGAELFTGNNLILASVLGGHAKFSGLLRNWAIVYFANFVGSVLLVLIIYASGIWKSNEMLVGVRALAIANAKVNLDFWSVLFRGIGCNWLVCLAVWMALSSRDVVGKIFAIFFPIMAFVALGFEHCVANMYFIPMGILLSGTEVATKATEIAQAAGKTLDLSNLTWSGFIVKNLIGSTIGNIIGGSGFVGLLYWSVYQRKDRSKPNAK
jgi:formate/nitrite transporter